MSELHAQSQVISSTGRLLKATSLAVAVATVILVTAVLPAEYGLDRTGIGNQLGLTVLDTPAEAAVPEVTVIEPAAAAPEIGRATLWATVVYCRAAHGCRM